MPASTPHTVSSIDGRAFSAKQALLTNLCFGMLIVPHLSCWNRLVMSLETVRAFFAENAPEIAVIESPKSSATVALAAEAYGVEPARIAKTLSLRIGEQVVLIVASGTARMDNKKLKARFGGKPKMLGVEEVADITGHEVGGVCPFGLKAPLPVYCDVSLKAFDEVVPAAGSIHSAVRIAPSRMAELVAAEWVDVC
jgi:prolyl-tRNA editing enzyme YbaK/EbsC (Cys-tRNA(Pro) deacylase)